MILFLGVLAYKASTALPRFFETRLARAFQYTFQLFCINPVPPVHPLEPGQGGAAMELMPLTSDQPSNGEEPNATLKLFNSEKPSVPIDDSPPPVHLSYPILTQQSTKKFFYASAIRKVFTVNHQQSTKKLFYASSSQKISTVNHHQTLLLLCI